MSANPLQTGNSRLLAKNELILPIFLVSSSWLGRACMLRSVEELYCSSVRPCCLSDSVFPISWLQVALKTTLYLTHLARHNVYLHCAGRISLQQLLRRYLVIWVHLKRRALREQVVRSRSRAPLISYRSGCVSGLFPHLLNPFLLECIQMHGFVWWLYRKFTP